MANPENEIILHNYPQSPVAEKVRVALGIKGLSWRDVEIPRLPPKPMLTTLTGGYRRTPVMQIGADIYCDSLCIVSELERRFPNPTFMPTRDAGLMWCLSRWTDGDLFDLSVKIVLGAAGENLPQAFAEDRGRLYMGANWAESLKVANQQLPHLVAQINTPLQWLDHQLGDGRDYLLGSAPAALDAQMYHVIWFLRGRWDGGPAVLSQFPDVERWEKNVSAIGHGSSQSMTSEDAIARAKIFEPLPGYGVSPNDPQGLETGTLVSIEPDVDGGEQPVEGLIHAANSNSVSLLRNSSDAGTVAVHFPRQGYRIHPIAS